MGSGGSGGNEVSGERELNEGVEEVECWSEGVECWSEGVEEWSLEWRE